MTKEIDHECERSNEELMGEFEERKNKGEMM